MFAPLTRRDQRATGQVYLRGLMAEGQRKSMQPMAARLGVDHQRLQQFITSSTWDYAAVRARLAGKAVEVVDPVAWVVDDTGQVKDGACSPGVARQYSGTVGKVANCQVAVSVHAVTDVASAPLDWRLFLPKSWDDQHASGQEALDAVAEARARCGIPDAERHHPKWRQALEMLDELAGWGLEPPVVAADAGYGDNAHFRRGLAERGLAYMVQVKDKVTAHPVDAVPQLPAATAHGPRGLARYRTKPVSLREHVRTAGHAAGVRVSWRQGAKGTLASRFVALRVRPAGRKPHYDPDGSLPPAWLLAEWPPTADEPVKYWISNLGPDTDLTTLVRLAKIRWRIEHDYRELKTGLGLDHFEGRSWRGWHRHTTLVSAAHLFLTLLRLTSPKAPGAD